MEGFYIAVLSIATIILMLILTTIGVAMRKGNADVAWPPGDAAKCPIGWEAGTTPTQCRIPDASLISGEIYSTYSNATPPVPLEPGYTENTGTADADWTIDSIAAASVVKESAASTFTVTVTDEIQARAFTQYRPIRIGTVDAGQITSVPTKSTDLAKYTTTTAGLIVSSLYNVYTSYSDAVNRSNSVGTGTTASTYSLDAIVLTFDKKPTVALSTSIYVVKSADVAAVASAANTIQLTGTYVEEKKKISFTATGPTATGAIYFKKAYFDFNDATYTRCGKKVFAKKFNLTWDGVSEYNKC